MKIKKEDNKDFKGFSIYKGVVRYNDLYYFLAAMDKLSKDGIPHGRIYEIDRERVGGENYDWSIVSASVCYDPAEKFIAIGSKGRVQVYGGGEIREESPIPMNEGLLQEVRGVAKGKAFAVGSGRQVYRRDDADHWVRIDQSAQKYADDLDPIDTCWVSIDGFAEDDIYVAGWQGELWHYDGNKWYSFESPKDVDLTRIRCGSDGVVYACGQMGTLIKIENKKCSVITQNLTEDTFYGMAYFQDKLYCSSTNSLYCYDGETLQEVDFKNDRPNTFHQLSTRDGILCSIGEKDVMQFDGQEWSSVLKIE